MKEIILDELVPEDIPAVKKIIATQAEDAKRRPAVKSLYSRVVDELSNGTRNTTAQIGYLEALEKSIAVFRTASLELRKHMDVQTLEQRLLAVHQALDTAAQRAGVQRNGTRNQNGSPQIRTSGSTEDISKN